VKELIYKSGHAGITKAEVSLRFDNRDKSMSPMGLEQHDNIVVTR
jgi:structural maintenance of chromosome 2